MSGLNRASLARASAASASRVPAPALETALRVTASASGVSVRRPSHAPLARLASAALLLVKLAAALAIGLVIITGVAIGTMRAQDSNEIERHLKWSGRSGSDLVCLGGRMVRGDDSLVDLLTERPRFVCTQWRTREALAEEADAAKSRRKP